MAENTNGFDCVVHTSHFCDSIGIFDTESEANGAGEDWLMMQSGIGNESESDELGYEVIDLSEDKK